MKTLLVGITVVSILALGTFAFAHGTVSWGGGHMMGPGYGGGHMTDQGYGGHMGGPTGPGYGTNQTDQKFLDETADLRKELHKKRFEYFEAQRNPDTTNKTMANLEKEITGLQEKIYENAPRTAYGSTGRGGHCF
jgi:hypothetical protein